MRGTLEQIGEPGFASRRSQARQPGVCAHAFGVRAQRRGSNSGRGGGLAPHCLGFDPRDRALEGDLAAAMSAPGNGGVAVSNLEIIADRARS
jgi:hypothetical protein